MKEHPTLIYVLWYSIDPWRRAVLSTHLPSRGGGVRSQGRLHNRTEDRGDSESGEGRFGRYSLPQRPWIKRGWREQTNILVFWLMFVWIQCDCCTALDGRHVSLFWKNWQPKTYCNSTDPPATRQSTVPPQSGACENEHFNTTEFPASVSGRYLKLTRTWATVSLGQMFSL